MLIGLKKKQKNKFVKFKLTKKTFNINTNYNNFFTKILKRNIMVFKRGNTKLMFLKKLFKRTRKLRLFSKLDNKLKKKKKAIHNISKHKYSLIGDIVSKPIHFYRISNKVNIAKIIRKRYLLKKKKKLKILVLQKRRKKRKSRKKMITFHKKFFKSLLNVRKKIRSYFFGKFFKNLRITKKISMIKKKNIKLPNYELMLFNVLTQSQLIMYKDNVGMFLKRSYVYVNGNVIKDKFKILDKYDCVQIIFSKNYLNCFKKSLIVFYKKIFKFRIKYWRIGRVKRQLLKQKPRHITNKALNLIFYKKVIPNYMEVDFTTFSLFIISIPNKYCNLNLNLFRQMSFINIAMYN